MDLVDQKDFSDDQKWIIHLRKEEKMTYRQIQVAWSITHEGTEDDFISPSAIKTCLKRTALALHWEKGRTYGNEPFLSQPDIDALKDYISEQCNGGDPIDTNDLISQALFIRRERQKAAINFLDSINCNNIADELRDEEIDEPVRSWLNGHLQELESSIKSGEVVDNDRYYSCTPQVLNAYFDISKQLLENTHPALIFGADETGLDPKVKKKYVVPNDIKEFLVKDQSKIPHFSAMLSNNCIGQAVPPFIIMPELENCPPEVKSYIITGQIWAVSSSSGWQTRNTFLIWTINFINWLSSFRLKLDEEIRDNSALLILDGHNSRENPLAIYLLKLFNINVLILPSHTTHLLQMFDVVLARKFKKRFSNKFSKKLTNQCLLNNRSMASAIRQCVISSLVEAWSETCTVEDCMMAAKVTSTYPYDPNIVLSSTFVHVLTIEEIEIMKKKRKNNRLNINSKVITDLDFLDKLNHTVYQKESFRHICVYQEVNYIDLCNEIKSGCYHDVNIFSRLHYFVPKDSAPVFF